MEFDDNILIQYLDHTLPEEERKQVETWMDASPDNKKIVEQLYFTLQLTERLHIMQTVDVEQAVDNFNKIRQRQKREISLGKVWLGFQRIAAVLMIPLLLWVGFLLAGKEGNDASQMVAVNTQPGVVSAFTLPDGSKVWLNAGSSLTYPSAFVSDVRKVQLAGEGYFEVAKNRKKPFIVEASPAYSVKVVGTTFNVSAYPDDDVIETTLVEGSVVVGMLSEKGGIVTQELKPDEKIRYKKTEKEYEVSPVRPEYATGWKDGEVIFRQDSMGYVLKVLGRHFNVKFDVKDPEIMKAVITARFAGENLEQVMEYLRLASGIKYKISNPLINDNRLEMKTIEISK